MSASPPGSGSRCGHHWPNLRSGKLDSLRCSAGPSPRPRGLFRSSNQRACSGSLGRGKITFSRYRRAVGSIVNAALSLLSFYTLALSSLRSFEHYLDVNFALSPFIIVFFASIFFPVIAGAVLLPPSSAFASIIGKALSGVLRRPLWRHDAVFEERGEARDKTRAAAKGEIRPKPLRGLACRFVKRRRRADVVLGWIASKPD